METRQAYIDCSITCIQLQCNNLDHSTINIFYYILDSQQCVNSGYLNRNRSSTHMLLTETRHICKQNKVNNKVRLKNSPKVTFLADHSSVNVRFSGGSVYIIALMKTRALSSFFVLPSIVLLFIIIKGDSKK